MLPSLAALALHTDVGKRSGDVLERPESDSKKRIQTPNLLTHAAIEGDLEPIRELLDEGADVNARDRNGDTALWWAIIRGHVAVVRLLLERGANVDTEYVRNMELSEKIKSLITDSKGIRARYLLKKFLQIVTAKRWAARIHLKAQVLVDGKKFAPPMRGERPPMRGEEGGEGFYAVEREFMNRLSRGDTSMSFSEFLRARMRGSAQARASRAMRATGSTP